MKVKKKARTQNPKSEKSLLLATLPDRDVEDPKTNRKAGTVFEEYILCNEELRF